MAKRGFLLSRPTIARPSRKSSHCASSKKTIKAKALPVSRFLEERRNEVVSEMKEERKKAREARNQKEDDKAAKKQRAAETTLQTEQLKEQNLATQERQLLAEIKKQEEQKKQQAIQRWLQTEYPQQLAHELINANSALSPEQRERRKKQ